MRLPFTTDELQLLAEILEHRGRELEHEIARTAARAFKHHLQTRQQLLTTVQAKLAASDTEWTAVEVDFIEEVLQRADTDLIGEIAHTSRRDCRKLLQAREKLLDHIHDKVTEACTVS